MIDHTLLRPDAVAPDVERLCEVAAGYRFKAVCVNPYWVRLSRRLLADSPVLVCSVVGFPFGAARAEVTATEAARAVDDGAHEIDMVLNLGALRGGDLAAAEAGVSAVRAATEGRVLKVILEAAALTPDELARAVELAADAGADLVKTSTGYHPAGGARVADVALMHSTLAGRPVGIKASGGVRSREFALELVDAGATRLGASASVALVTAED
jgi:deoxyribose-phosphate aldolase